jgi:hypothetical protein
LPASTLHALQCSEMPFRKINIDAAATLEVDGKYIGKNFHINGPVVMKFCIAILISIRVKLTI